MQCQISNNGLSIPIIGGGCDRMSKSDDKGYKRDPLASRMEFFIVSWRVVASVFSTPRRRKLTLMLLSCYIGSVHLRLGSPSFQQSQRPLK